MADMLVNLMHLPEKDSLVSRLKSKGIYIRRALPPDKLRIVEWVRQNHGISAASECDVCFAHSPVSCYIATRGFDILGFGCYNATAPDFFGPTFVLPSERGQGVGKALLLSCLHALRETGYAYGIIGSIGPQEYYETCVGAVLIPDSTPGLYKDYLGGIENGEVQLESEEKE